MTEENQKEAQQAQDAQGKKEAEEAAEKLTTFVVEEIKKGSDKITISEKLVRMGLDSTNASEFVGKMYPTIMQQAEQEQLTTEAIMGGVIGGLLTAVIGGIIWGLIVKFTHYEIGYIAWGIGFVCGVGVVLFTKGKKGIPLQLVAVLSSILGIFIGKYFYFFYGLKEMLTKKGGAEVAAKFSLFSPKMFQLFVENISDMLSGYDILWVILAVLTAYRIPKGLGIKVPGR